MSESDMKDQEVEDELKPKDLLEKIDELDDIEDGEKVEEFVEDREKEDDVKTNYIKEEEPPKEINSKKDLNNDLSKKQHKNKKSKKEKSIENVETKENNENYSGVKKEKAIIKVEKQKKPSLIDKVEQQKNRNIFLIVIFIILCILVLIFSVIFALLNVTKSVIIDGVSIKNIDVSNLSASDAEKKISEAMDIELNAPIKLKSKDYEIILNTNQIEFTYNVSKAVEKAYSLGRNGNIFQNNYSILRAYFFGNKLDINYDYNSNALDYFVEDIESKIPDLVTEASYYIEDNELIIIPGKDGIIVNKEKLKKNIINTIVNANAVDLLENETELVIEIPTEDVKAKEIDVDKIHSEIYTEPRDAYYEPEPEFKIYPQVDGVDFSISLNEAKEMIKKKREEYRIELEITPAEKTIKDIGLEAFPYEISKFTTKYDASNKNRSQNLAIAAGKIDGTLLMPGDEFSFNQVVGKRTIEEGYKDAKIYQDGKVVDGLAGGICQISSTLYNAVVKANLEVTERRNHSFTTSYVRAGQDATVVYGVIDFKFKNTRTYPIKISASVDSGIVEFIINGIKEEVEYDVSLNPVTTGAIPYTIQYIQDPSLVPGQQVVVQSGGNGLKVTTYKETRLDGKLVSREVVSTDTYNPMAMVIRVAP